MTDPDQPRELPEDRVVYPRKYRAVPRAVWSRAGHLTEAVPPDDLPPLDATVRNEVRRRRVIT